MRPNDAESGEKILGPNTIRWWYDVMSPALLILRHEDEFISYIIFDVIFWFGMAELPTGTLASNFSPLCLL